ncbi:MAG: HAD-IB family hydrolase [Desulfarculaceae bacterium]
MTLPNRPAAFFDVDKTLVPGNTMERAFMRFLIRKGYLQTGDLARYLVFLARNLPELNEGLIHRNKYHLKDKDPQEIQRLAGECFESMILPRISPTGRDAVDHHRQAGHMVVLLTGSLQPLAEHLRRELGADMVVAARLGVSDGTLNGTLANSRPYGPEKARLVQQLAYAHKLDLQRSYAYGDHHSDVHVLNCVGYPRAVNPSFTLRLTAKRRGWPILVF